MAWSGGVFTRTNGVYTGSTVWAQDAAAAVKITSARHDTHDQDLASGINACMAKDGSNTVTALKLTATVNATTGVITIGGVNFANMKGSQNVFVGGSGNFSLSGSNNAGFGALALTNITSGSSNTALGVTAGNAITTESDNTFIGLSAGYAVSGSANTCLGSGAMGVNTFAGSNNCAIGASALSAISSGDGNVAIGYAADVTDATNNQLSIQNAIFGTGNSAQGPVTVSTGNIGFYTRAPSARVHLPAGTATAGTAPLKLTAGTNLTAVEDGAFEFDGSALYFTVGGVRKTVTLT